jgi:hypothetical protein
MPESVTWTTGGKNERMCVSCRRNFWAWDTGRERCYLCEPLDPIETQRVLATLGVRPPERRPVRLSATAVG